MTKQTWLNQRLEKFERLRPYVVGQSVNELARSLGRHVSEIVKLDSNENFLYPKEILASILCQLSNSLDPRQYPTDEKDELIEALSKYVNVSPQQIVVGNGSDELIELVARNFLRGNEEAITVYPTFVMYRIIMNSLGNNLIEVPLDSKFRFNSSSMLKACTERTVLCFLCSPNNPTGNQFPREEIRAFAEDFKGIVLLDEAYVEFAQYSLTDLVETLDNLIVVRTFSKAFGLAGMRIGYLVASARIASCLRRVQLPYNLNVMSLAMARAVLNRPEVMLSTVQAVKKERSWLSEALSSLLNVIVYPSDANFILFRTSEPSKNVARDLRARGVLIRSFDDSQGLEGCLRVTVGTRKMNVSFLEALEDVLQSRRR
ncbi:MAG: histidinol-phosphate transaminase [Candidatus Bathyarchaeia archaeon]